MTPTLHQQAERRFRQDVKLFKAYLATPATTTLKLPANGLFFVRADSIKIAGIACTVVGRTTHSIRAPALAANAFHPIGKLTIDSTVTMAAGYDLYIDVGLGKRRRVVNG